jgi:hypothetical protein
MEINQIIFTKNTNITQNHPIDKKALKSYSSTGNKELTK